MKKYSKLLIQYTFCVLSGLCGLSDRAYSQETEDDDNITELSPFEVNVTESGGYRAANTLGGTRVNTELKDLASQISVFTSEFIEDTASNNVHDALRYATNTMIRTNEITGNESTQNNNLNALIRGLEVEPARNYFRLGINSDTYNVSRIEFNRGPNNILFGVGSPGGIINTMTKQAIFGDNFTEVTLQARSDSGWRTAIDINHEIIDDKLGVRFNGVLDQEDNWRHRAYEDQARGHLAVRYQPFRKSTIKAEYEYGEIDSVQPRAWGPNDGFSGWLANGSPPVVAGQPLPVGTTMLGNGTAPVLELLISGTAGNVSGLVQDWTGTALSAVPAGANASGKQVLDFSIVPQEANLWGPGNIIETEYHTYTVSWIQELTSDWHFEVAYNFQKQDDMSSEALIWNPTLYIDPNQSLPDGSPNPHYGDYFVRHDYEYFDDDFERDTLRGTTSYSIDLADKLDGTLGEILGRHNFAVLAQRERQEQTRVRNAEINTTPLPGAPTLAHAQNIIYRRTYLDFDTAGGLTYQVTPRELPMNESMNIVTKGGVSGQVTPGLIPVNATGTKEKLDSFMFVMQNYWWDGRIVTVYGRRKDSLSDGPLQSTAVNGRITNYSYQPLADLEDGHTVTKGIVVHPVEWVSLFYNESDNFRENDNRINYYGERLPARKGLSEDYGVRLNLLENRLYLSFARYKTTSKNAVLFAGIGAQANVINDLWWVLDPTAPNRDNAANAIPSNRDKAGVIDEVSTGYEIEISGNILPNWTFIANYANPDNVNSSPGARNWNYIQEHLPTWEAAGRDTPLKTPGALATVGDAIDRVVGIFEQRVLVLEGNPAFLTPDYTANFFTRYTFADGPLEGVSIGGGMRLQGDMVVNFTSTGQIVKGGRHKELDFGIGYEREIRGGVLWSVQLNIMNVFNEEILIPMATNPTTQEVERVRFLNPRAWRITTSFRF